MLQCIRTAACAMLELVVESPAKKQRPSDDFARYDVGRVLGEGAFAVVRRAVEKETGVARAMKLVDRQRSRPDIMAKEVQLLDAAGVNQHIIALVEHFETSNFMVLVLELVSGGEVFERIATQGRLSEALAGSVVCQVAKALVHLHDRHIVHRDLKPENLLYVNSSPDADVK